MRGSQAILTETAGIHNLNETAPVWGLCRLVKAGLLDKRYARRFARISAWAELVGYMGNVTLNCMRIATNLERELALSQDLDKRKKVGAFLQEQASWDNGEYGREGWSGEGERRRTREQGRRGLMGYLRIKPGSFLPGRQREGGEDR
jgi:hypothetical protein